MATPEPSLVRRFVAGIGLVAVCLMLASGWGIYRGESDLARSNAALLGGDAREAIVWARRSARWYVPGAPHVSVAYARLAALGDAAESHGQTKLALLAWSSVRQASLETRWLITPYPSARHRAEARLAALRAGQDPANATEVSQQLLKSFAQNDRPRSRWIAALVVGLGLLGFGLLWGARRAVGGAGRVSWQRARRPFGLAAVGAVLWLLALWFA